MQVHVHANDTFGSCLQYISSSLNGFAGLSPSSSTGKALILRIVACSVMMLSSVKDGSRRSLHHDTKACDSPCIS